MGYSGKAEEKSQGFHLRISRETYDAITASALAQAQESQMVLCLEAARKWDMPYKTREQIEGVRRQVSAKTGRSFFTREDLIRYHLRRTGHIGVNLDDFVITH